MEIKTLRRHVTNVAVHDGSKVTDQFILTCLDIPGLEVLTARVNQLYLGIQCKQSIKNHQFRSTHHEHIGS